MQCFCTIDSVLFSGDALCVIWRGGKEREKKGWHKTQHVPNGQINMAHWLGLQHSSVAASKESQ